MKNGIAGNIAKGFLQSKLSLLLMVAFLLIGAYSIYLIPREEEPQIVVPVADIFLGAPGASPQEIERLYIAPLEKIIWNVKGIEHVYSSSMNGQAMLTAQFKVGEDLQRSLVNLYNEILKHMDQMPPGVSMPLIKTRSIDDVPVLSITLWSRERSDYIIRQQAELIEDEIKKIPNVTNVHLIGGRSRQLTIEVDRSKLAGFNLDLTTVSNYIQGANHQQVAGKAYRSNTVFQLETGNFLKSAEEVKHLIVGMNKGVPVYLSSIATVKEGQSLVTSYVSYEGMPAVTIAVSKQQGADANGVYSQVLTK
ncbi:MAG: efflux RND transporter permease subunit, partial [Bacteroidaceae bacterium]|nr:efflux RND transporter permease subunit [Bacteroidaceae bacterium]